MNNVAVCFAQHPLNRRVETVTPPSTPLANESIPGTRKELLEAAQNWARNAYQHATVVQEPTRTEECDQACAVALCNLGDVFFMSGEPEEARRKFNEAIAVSDKIGFPAGASQARAGLQKLTATSSRRS